MIVRYVASRVHLCCAQRQFLHLLISLHFNLLCSMLLCRIFQCSKYHAKIQSFVYPVHLVLSLNCLPTWSYSASQLTITVLYSGPKCTKRRRLIIAFHRTQTENLYLLHILIGKYPTWTGLPYHKQLSFTKGASSKGCKRPCNSP